MYDASVLQKIETQASGRGELGPDGRATSKKKKLSRTVCSRMVDGRRRLFSPFFAQQTRSPIASE